MQKLAPEDVCGSLIVGLHDAMSIVRAQNAGRLNPQTLQALRTLLIERFLIHYAEYFILANMDHQTALAFVTYVVDRELQRK